jgi:hypothetical protein
MDIIIIRQTKDGKGGARMKVSKTLRCKILDESRIFDATLDIYNRALSFLIDVIDHEIKDADAYDNKTIIKAVETLVHATKNNPEPAYGDFDKNFYKFPSYLTYKCVV